MQKYLTMTNFKTHSYYGWSTEQFLYGSPITFSCVTIYTSYKI